MTATHRCLHDRLPARGNALAALAALAAGALVPGAARAQSGPRWIDVHFHIYPKPLVAAMQAYQAKYRLPPVGGIFTNWTPERALAQLDANGVATAFLSLASPRNVWFEAPPATVPALSRACNEEMAAVVRARPERFGFFASLPMPDVDASLAEIGYAFDALRADAIGLPTSFGAVWPGDARFAPIFAELDRRNAVVVFHPYAPNCCSALPTGIPESVLEYPFDTARTIVNLLASGTFKAYPNVRWVFSHGGGVIPFLAGRIRTIMPLQHPLDAVAPDGVDAVFRKLYYDTASAAFPAALAAIAAYLPPSQLLFGTDWPYANVKATIAGLTDAAFPAATLAAIAHDNAATLFPKLRAR